MSDPLIETLALDLSPALASLDDLDNVLLGIATSFGTSLNDAVLAATSVVAAEPIPIDVDTTAAEAAVDELVQPGTIAVDADVSAAATSIGQLDAEPVVIDVDADTTAARDQIDELASSTSDAAVGLEQVTGAADNLGVATGLAAGSADGLVSAVGALGPAGKGTAVAVATLSAFTAALVGNAIEGETATNRLNLALGDQAEKINAIGIPGFAADLDELAVKTGNSDEALRLAAARIGDLGSSAGASKEQIADAATNIDLLAVRLSVVNPALGDAGQIADQLTNALARGGRALAPYGIALNSAEINARALADTGRATADELSIFERSAAGAALATEKLGDRLQRDIVEASEQPEVKLRALRTRLDEFLEALGTPLIAPSLDVLESLLPVAEALGATLANLVRIALPALASVEPALAPIVGTLDLTAEGLGFLADIVEGLPAPVIATAVAIGIYSAAAANAVPVTAALTTAMEVATGPLGLAVAALSLLGLVVREFGDDADDAVEQAQAFGDALFGQVKQVDDLQRVVASLGDNTIKALRADEIAKEHKHIADAINDQGRSYSELADAITGTRDEYLQYRDSITETAELERDYDVDRAKRAARVLGDLEELRDAYEASVEQQLKFLVNSGEISQTQLDVIRTTNQQTDGTTDLTSVLETATAIASAHADAQREQAFTSAEASGALAQLRAELVLGKTTTDEAIITLGKLGIVGDEATGFIDDTREAVADFASTVQSTLPETSDAIAAYTAGVSDAYSKLSSDVSSGADTVKASADQLNAALDPQRFTEALYGQAVTLSAFSDNIAAIAAAGNEELAAELARQGPEVAGALAAQLASDPVEAANAQAMIVLGQKASAKYAETLAEHVVEDVVAPGEAGGDAFTGAFYDHLDLGTAALTATEDFRKSPEYKRILQLNGIYGAEAGASWHEGQAAGTRRGQPAVEEAAGDLVDGAEKSARRVARAKSPSELFAELGDDLAAGVAVGMNRGLADVALSGAALLDAALPRNASLAAPDPFSRVGLPRGASLAVANRGPLGELNAAPVSASGGSEFAVADAVDRMRGHVDRLLVSVDELMQRKNVNVQVDLHRVDVDPHHISREIARTIRR